MNATKKAKANQRQQEWKARLSKFRTRLTTAKNKLKNVMRKYMSINAHYVVQLKKAIVDTTKLKATSVKEREEILKRTLYELNPRKQRRAEMQLENIDRLIDHSTRHIEKCRSNLKKSEKTQKVLVDRVQPKKVCKGRVMNHCKMCRGLARTVRGSIKRQEEDRIILERVQRACDRKLPNEQIHCYDIAFKVVEIGFATFDPSSFRVKEVCQKIEACKQ